MQWPKSGPDSEARRLRAESLIESSGDGRAIRQLGLLRRDPRRWGTVLLNGARDSLVLKVALGVFLGIVAADAIRGVLQGDLLQSLADRVDQAIGEAGGAEALEALAARDLQSAGDATAADESMSDEASMAEPDSGWDDSGDEDLTDGLDLPF